MARKILKNISVIVAVINLVPYLLIEAFDLTTVTCQARLPIPSGYFSTYYDGEDTIYLFGGGSNVNDLKEALKYSISQDNIQPAGQLPSKFLHGSVITDENKNIYHVGWSTGIFQYFPDSRNFTRVGSFPKMNYGFATIQPDENTALLIAGITEPRNVIKLDLKSFKSDVITQLVKERNEYVSAIWVEQKGVAYIFSGISGSNCIYKYNPSTNELQILPVFYPTRQSTSKAVWDGQYGYIIGGFDSTVPVDSILQFDPDTENFRFIHVVDYPRSGSSTYAFDGTSAVYVEKLNRIYMFGGVNSFIGGIAYRDEIWYISLDPLRPPTEPTTSQTTTTEIDPRPTLSPEIFDCSGLRESIHPFPYDCAKFILCRDNHAYSFHCPKYLLFSVKTLRCTWPDLVDCQV